MTKVAVVTGCGRPLGIGRATARRLAADGYRVVVSDIGAPPTASEIFGVGDDPDALEQLAEEIRAVGVDALAVTADLTDRDDCRALIEQAVAWGGRLDTLVNCAGSVAGSGPFLELDPAAWHLSLAVNVGSLYHLGQYALPSLIADGGGSIVAIASTAGLGGEPMLAAYDAAKFAVVGLVKSLAAEFGPEKVRVNAVCPGAVATDMGRESYAYLANLQGMSIEEAKAMYTSFAALRRSGEAREIASVVSFLCSEDASYVTGAALPASGGTPPGI